MTSVHRAFPRVHLFSPPDAMAAEWQTIRRVHEQLLLFSATEFCEELMRDYEKLLVKVKKAKHMLALLQKGEHIENLEELLGDSTLKISWLLEKVPHLMDSIGINKVNCQVLSTDGFVSQIVRVIINDTNNAIVKMPETKAIRKALIATLGVEKTKFYWPDDEEESRIKGMQAQFNREVDFYNFNDIRGLKIPWVYHCQKWRDDNPGALVMEDLTHLKSVSFFDTMSVRQVEEVCSELQIMHLYSRNPSPVWRQKFPFPEGLLNLLKGLQPVVQGFIDTFPELDYLYQRFKHLYSDYQFIEYIMMQSHREIGLPDVICHGDLWTYNFLWHADKNHEASDHLGAIIDWQGPHFGSVGEDFAHMLVFCCSPEVRHRAEREVLPRHYRRLAKLTQHYPKFTLENFMRAYKRQLVMHAMHLPFIANVMLKYKDVNNNGEADHYTKALLERVRSAWEDAWEVLQTDMRPWAYKLS